MWQTTNSVLVHIIEIYMVWNMHKCQPLKQYIQSPTQAHYLILAKYQKNHFSKKKKKKNPHLLQK